MLSTKSRVKTRLRVTSINLNSALIYFLALFIATNALAEPPASNQANTATTNKQVAPNCITITIYNVDPENNAVDQTPVSVPIDTSPATHRLETLHTQPKSAAAANNSQLNNSVASKPMAGNCP